MVARINYTIKCSSQLFLILKSSYNPDRLSTAAHILKKYQVIFQLKILYTNPNIQGIDLVPDTLALISFEQMGS